METTKERLKSITQNTKPSASIFIDLEEAGGISNVNSSGEIVRNVRQAKHYRTSGNSSNTASGVTNDPLPEAIQRRLDSRPQIIMGNDHLIARAAAFTL